MTTSAPRLADSCVWMNRGDPVYVANGRKGPERRDRQRAGAQELPAGDFGVGGTRRGEGTGDRGVAQGGPCDLSRGREMPRSGAPQRRRDSQLYFEMSRRICALLRIVWIFAASSAQDWDDGIGIVQLHDAVTKGCEHARSLEFLSDRWVNVLE
jgi:hypothetical protein